MNTCALRAFLKLFNVAHFLMLSGRAFHVRGPLYENEFLKISRGAWGVISMFVEVDALVSLMTTSSCIILFP